MHLSPSSQRLKKEVDHRICNTLEKIRLTLNLNVRIFSDYLKITEKSYTENSTLRKAPPLEALFNILEVFSLSFDSVIEGKINYKALSEHYHGNKSYIPERYTTAAFSKKRTSIHMLDFLENVFSWKTRLKVLRHFQIPESCFYCPDEMINIFFLSDLCEYLKVENFSEQTLFLMGQHSVISNLNSEFGKFLSTFGSPQDLHERIFTDLINQYYDKNHLYNLMDLKKNSCTIEALCNPKVTDLLKVRNLGNHDVCIARAGGFSSLTGYLGLPYSKVNEMTCVHKGDPSCKFEIDYSDAATRYQQTSSAMQQPSRYYH